MIIKRKVGATGGLQGAAFPVEKTQVLHMKIGQSYINIYPHRSYRPVPCYYHRAQVTFIDPDSTYIYNTIRAWFNSMRAALQGRPTRAKLKLKGWDLWEGYNKQKRYVYQLFNS